MTILGVGWLIACCLGSPALLGLWTARLWYDKLESDALIANPAGIAVGISLVAAASAAAGLAPEIQKEAGDWVRYTGAFAAAMFLVGAIVGWMECRVRKRKRQVERD